MRVVILIMAALWLAACQLPSEEVVSGDSSAGLSFQLINADSNAAYDVYVDGLLMGKARDFKKGHAILKILPGSHVVRIEQAGQVVLEEQVYVAAGANRVIVIR